MKYLLDAHTLLWFIAGDPKLSPPARAAIEAPANERLVSIATLWEIAIKVSLGKLAMAVPFGDLAPRYLSENDMRILPITVPHLHSIAQLPFHHRDPFDRLLIAQALVEGVQILSSDVVFDQYGVSRLWR